MIRAFISKLIDFELSPQTREMVASSPDGLSREEFSDLSSIFLGCSCMICCSGSSSNSSSSSSCIIRYNLLRVSNTFDAKRTAVRFVNILVPCFREFVCHAWAWRSNAIRSESKKVSIYRCAYVYIYTQASKVYLYSYTYLSISRTNVWSHINLFMHVLF